MNDFTATQPICHFHHTINTWYIQGIGWTCSYCRQDGIEYKVLTKNEARRILFDLPVVEKDKTKWCAYKNCDGPFTPTEDVRQKYCSKRCAQAAKNSRGQRNAKRAAKKAEYEASQAEKLMRQQGFNVTHVIVDEMTHIWGVDYDDPETQKIKSEPKSFHDFGDAFDLVNLRDRITRPMQLKAEVHNRIRKMAEDDVAMILEFGMQYTDIKFEAYQLVVMYHYFYKLHRKEALGE